MKWRRLRQFGVFALVVFLAFAAAWMTGFELVDAFQAIPRVAVWMAQNLIPKAEAFEKLPRILDKLVETILMSIMASITASVFSFFFALMGAKTTQVSPILAGFARVVASINRNIPIAAWAMIFLLAYGQSSFTGFLALFFASFGFLTRAYMETIDESVGKSVEALKAVGAGYFHIVAQSIIPGTMPQLLSWTLFIIETNIRSATLVGLLTGSGIGFTFSIYYKSMQYSAASLVVLSIVVVVLAIELLSNTVRRRIL